MDVQIFVFCTLSQCRFITILDIIHRPVFYLNTQLKSIGLSVPHEKHITSPLRAKQDNSIYRFVTMV
jgi:hypothetical protein